MNHGQIKFIVVQTLPVTNIDPNAIYLVPITPDTEQNNYEEYIYVNNQWELLGKIAVHVDLSNYYTKQETNSLLDNKQAKIDSSNKLSSDLVDDTNNTNKFVTTSDKTNWNAKEDSSNKVTSISSSSTDTQYPSAKCVYNIVGNIESILEELDIGGGV